MSDLFIPNNLVLQKDGSVKPRDFAKEIVPEKDESFIHLYNRMEAELAHLKSYERGMWIPYFQEQKLYKVIITSCPTHLTQKEEDECLQPRVIFTKYFLEKETALQWATNKIKQQSIACYYSKYNPMKRQYKFSYFITNDKEKVYIHEEAVNGKIIKREVAYGC